MRSQFILDFFFPCIGWNPGNEVPSFVTHTCINLPRPHPHRPHKAAQAYWCLTISHTTWFGLNLHGAGHYGGPRGLSDQGAPLQNRPHNLLGPAQNENAGHLIQRMAGQQQSGKCRCTSSPPLPPAQPHGVTACFRETTCGYQKWCPMRWDKWPSVGCARSQKVTVPETKDISLPHGQRAERTRGRKEGDVLTVKFNQDK